MANRSFGSDDITSQMKTESHDLLHTSSALVQSSSASDLHQTSSALLQSSSSPSDLQQTSPALVQSSSAQCLVQSSSSPSNLQQTSPALVQSSSAQCLVQSSSSPSDLQQTSSALVQSSSAQYLVQSSSSPSSFVPTQSISQMGFTLHIIPGSSSTQNLSQMAFTLHTSSGSDPIQNLSQMASTFPISTGSGSAQNISQMFSTMPLSIGFVPAQSNSQIGFTLHIIPGVVPVQSISRMGYSLPSITDSVIVHNSISQMGSTLPMIPGSSPAQNLSQMTFTLPISTGSGPAQNLSQMASTMPISTGTMVDLSHDSGLNKSNMLKKFEKKFKLIKIESIQLEKSAQEAISFWHLQCQCSWIITGAVSFLSIAKLPCYTVDIFGGLLLLFLLGMAYPSICAVHKLRYVDALLERLKGRLANLITNIQKSSVAQSEDNEELQSLEREVGDFELRVKSHYGVHLIVQMVCAIAYFLMMLFIAYKVFCGDDHNPDGHNSHGQNLDDHNPLVQVWKILQPDQSEKMQERKSS